MNGTDLLAEFRETGADRAFGELVRRYTNLVYSVAKRRLGNDSLAQEVAQTVFLRLADASPKLNTDAELGAWLHRTTIHVSIDLWRSENRRRAREEKATAMQTEHTESPAWSELAPVLDEALNELADTDRQAILLRFFSGKTMREVGLNFGVSEDAAKMRVSRALDRLRGQLSAKGVACGVAALTVILTDKAVEAAPIQLVTTLEALTYSAPTGVAAGILAFWLQLSKAKLAAVIAGSVLVLVTAVFFLHRLGGTGSTAALASGETLGSNSIAVPDRGGAAAVPASDAGGVQKEPDPLKLLQVAANARQQIASGEMELLLASYEIGRRFAGTNLTRIALQFDGVRRRFDAADRQYMFVSMAPDANATTEAAQRQQGLDNEAAVKAGLLKGFDARVVAIYDGSRIMEYRENDKRPQGATINDVDHRSASYLFDPRLLGISATLGFSQSVENSLDYGSAKAIQLIGREFVGGVLAWHVHMVSRYNEPLDFWIDTDHPRQIVKYMSSGDIVLSRYDEANPRNPIPAETDIVVFNNREPFISRRITCTKARFGISIDPALWTLAGLNMAVGTVVSDIRIHRSIGYWAGNGLIENLPAKGNSPEPVPDQAEQIAVLDNNPSSPEALEAAQWIILNTPDGPEVEKAAGVIVNNHIGSTNLLSLAVELERFRHLSSGKLLAALIEKNPDSQIRGNAVFTLAVLRKEEANGGQNKQATAGAEKLFERTIAEFGKVRRKGAKLADLARPELMELQHLIVGKPAPVTEGEDLDGREMKLSEYRGKVVALLFWTYNCPSEDERREVREMAARLAGKPFALVGVNGDRDLSRVTPLLENSEVTWRSFDDGRDGPISKAWNVDSWPTFIVLDAKGIIRYRKVRGADLSKAIDTLLKD